MTEKELEQLAKMIELLSRMEEKIQEAERDKENRFLSERLAVKGGYIENLYYSNIIERQRKTIVNLYEENVMLKEALRAPEEVTHREIEAAAKILWGNMGFTADPDDSTKRKAKAVLEAAAKVREK